MLLLQRGRHGWIGGGFRSVASPSPAAAVCAAVPERQKMRERQRRRQLRQRPAIRKGASASEDRRAPYGGQLGRRAPHGVQIGAVELDADSARAQVTRGK